MERERKTKVIAIVVLLVAVVGMSLGFAVFSNILTISSSATVTPNEDEFKMKAYGFVDWRITENFSNLSQYASETKAVANVSFTNDVSTIPVATDAVIDNSDGKNITISNLSVNFTNSSQSAAYGFIVKNEGLYNAYIDLSQYNIDSSTGVFVRPVNSCEAGNDATPELVTLACKQIYNLGYFGKPINNGVDMDIIVSGIHEIVPGDYITLIYAINYETDGALADGPFTVGFDDIVLKFSSSSEIVAE